MDVVAAVLQLAIAVQHLHAIAVQLLLQFVLQFVHLLQPAVLQLQPAVHLLQPAAMQRQLAAMQLLLADVVITCATC